MSSALTKHPVNGKDRDPMLPDSHQREEQRLLPERLPNLIGTEDDMSRRALTDHEAETLRTLLSVAQGQERLIKLQEDQAKALSDNNEIIKKMFADGTKASLPTWLMSILVAAVLTLLSWIYIEQMGDLRGRVQTSETFIKNTREQMIAHGWKLDREGNLYWPGDDAPQNPKGK
jgi:hypothetical protein